MSNSTFIRARATLSFGRARLLQSFGDARGVELNEFEHETLYPATTRRYAPALYLPDELEKVRKLAFEGSIAEELASISGGMRPIGATNKYLLRDVLIGFGRLFSRNQYVWMSSRFNWTRNSKVKHLKRAALRSSKVGCHYFGHWLRDDAATHIIANADGFPVALRYPSWEDVAFYKAALNQEYEELDFAAVDELIVYDDIYQNYHKADRLNMLRRQMAAAVSYSPGSGVCYLMRGSDGASRNYINESAILEKLEKLGVKIVRAGEYSTERLVSELLGARIVISVEGSQISHALLTLKSNGGIITIQPPTRFWNSHYDWTSTLGMRYGIVVADETSEGHYVNPDRLAATIELVDRSVA